MTGGHIEVLTMVNTIDFLVKYKKETIAAIQQAFETSIAAAKTAQVAAAPSQEDVLGKIQKLAELQAAGVLTEAEFAEKKADLLDRL